MTETTLEMWWPHPDAFHDLDVTDIEDGWQLSAPDDSELGAWLDYWSQDEDHHAVFQEEFIAALLSHIKTLDLENGQAETVSDEQSGSGEQAEDDGSRTLS
jgi:hypothetical protein